MVEQQSEQRIRYRQWLTLMQGLGLLYLCLLVVGGISESLVREGRLPGVRYGYIDNNLQLAESADYDTALPELRTAAILDFDNVAAQAQLLSVAYGANDAENAIVAIRGLLRFSQDDHELHANLAGLLLDTGDAEKAILHGRRATQLQPSSSAYQCVYGSALLSAGKPRDAAAAFRRALELDPNSSQAKQALAYPLKDY